MSEWFSTIVAWYMAHINYGTVILMMSIESSFLPLPSEVVIPPAAWKAAEGAMNPFLIVLCGILGSLIGALFNYFFARTLGRVIIYRLADTKLAHLIMINKESVEKAEAYFIKFGNSATFIGRLVPGIRHLISIPAGLAKMKLTDFVFYTALGAGIWTAILTALGYLIYSQQELLEKYYAELSYALLGLGIVFIIYLIYRSYRKNELKKNNFKEVS
jgi:membrane protein DedA with SNARE-associated domain